MDNPYYKRKIMIAKCDKKGNVIGQIERWKAHEEAILHRAFSVAILYKGKFIVQHRKHPVFDGTMDVTSSSHQLYKDGGLQDTIEAVYDCLLREWNITKKDLLTLPKDMGTIYYKAKDKYSKYWEHEVCNVVICSVKKLPSPNMDMAYGYSLVTREELTKPNTRLSSILTPWVKVMMEKKLL